MDNMFIRSIRTGGIVNLSNVKSIWIRDVSNTKDEGWFILMCDDIPIVDFSTKEKAEKFLQNLELFFNLKVFDYVYEESDVL